ncbi:MAG TPA: PVC-type heme-binding CxxCH protein [Gemmataceae bacterium]|nr:PVC-type heme-binding CxxCH protein [Gemmataceae bacterium]
MTRLRLYPVAIGKATGAILVVAALSAAPVLGAEQIKLSVLLLGDNGHHRPAAMAKVLKPALARAGIKVDYTADVEALTPATLSKYDALAVYRDSGDLPAKQEAAVLEFVEGGKGLVAIHCASHCFRNSDKYTALVGGRFLRHTTGVFRARIIDAQHPAVRGVKSFESWDETYVHNQLADDIRVLMVREEQGGYEPYTWVRDQGKGRVFYTALGHDEHTWKNESFHQLLAQGIRWAAGRATVEDVKPFRYVKAKVPNYLPGRQWGTTGEPIRRMQAPLEPAESMKHFHLPEGFEVQLYAAEPDIAKPIAMAWDARGRLWIAETVDYPNDMQPPGQGHDRITICEDSHGDGRADKFTVFADKLSIPTSLTFANGGLVVAQAPRMLFLKSSKGDDRVDVRRVLFRGWGTSDTHSGPSNLRWGFDNWLWGTVGYSGFHGEVGGHEQWFGQGVFRMKPNGSQMEFLTSTSNNTWGLGFGETGQVFASTANNQHSVYLAIPNRHFEGVRGWYGRGSRGIEDHKKFHPVTRDVRQVDFHGGFTAAAGHALYTARSFPPEYWNRAAFVCEPTGHLVHVDWLVPRGSDYVARDGYNLLASDDAWTAPIMAEVGPDGALWVIDWYNYIVQHNPTPSGFQTGRGGAYVTPLRDKTHGRIYRIVYKGAKPGKKPHLDRAGPAELVAALGHENLWWRQTAQRLLVERGKDDVLPLLATLVRDTKNGRAALHALWTMDGLGAFTTPSPERRDVLRAGLAHAGVCLAALGVLPRTGDSVADILAARCLTNHDAHVRSEALLALGEMPGSKEAALAIVAMLQEPRNAGDRWIPSAAISAAARSDVEFLQAAATARPKPEVERPFAEVVRVVAGHLGRRAPVDAAGGLLAALGKAQPAVAEALLAGLARGWPASSPAKLDNKGEAALAVLPSRLSPGGVLQLAVLLQRWGQRDKLQGLTASIKRTLLARVQDDKLADDARLAAARDLVTLGSDASSFTALLEQITPQAAPALTRGLLDAVGQSTSDDVGRALVKRWAALTPAARPTALAVLLRRPAWTRALLAGLEQGQVDKSDLGVDQAQQLSRHPDQAIASRARKLLAGSGRLPSADRQKVLDALLPLAKRRGSAALGKLVFEKNCAKCHRLGDAGQTVGPDLTGIAVRDRADILIDILDPNRSVEGNYRQYTIETKEGLLLTGLLTAETKTAVEMLDSEAKKHVVLREDIDNIISSKQSLMPEGFEKLPREDLVSLLDFLTARSRFFALPLRKAATITSVRGMFYDRDSAVERLVFPKWGTHTVFGVPFQVIDPRGGSIPNVILLYGPEGAVSRQMPRSASVPCNAPAKAIHLLSGVGGWCYPASKKGSVSMIVRLHYADGKSEDHPLVNGVHFADYIHVVDVPDSKLAIKLPRQQQVRYLAVTPKRQDKIKEIEFLKGDDATAPLVVAVTVEGQE